MRLRVPSCCEHGTGQCSAPAVSDTTHETLSSTLELELCLQDEERCKMYFMIIFDIKERYFCMEFNILTLKPNPFPSDRRRILRSPPAIISQLFETILQVLLGTINSL
ncbi:hypothetical protein NC653_023499 [Populus alba x Populus x berolinensis]|uniref:Uncharacterized protein n=1 Tax=Populus alba x Populus x berolinensis TaxID=444605 RepID=A0AAD6QAS3_9ROSI|nr:hypothetical protein NC653_023499 [Populus alba x Populus x berolinensis]